MIYARFKGRPKKASEAPRSCTIGKWALYGLFLVVILVSVYSCFRPSSDERIWQKLYHGRYEEARDDLVDLFPGIENPSAENHEIYSLAMACCFREKGQIDQAFSWIDDINSWQFSEKQYAFYRKQYWDIYNRYRVYSAGRKDASEEKAPVEVKVPEIPYVGMPESMVSQTLLGQPNEEVRHNTEMVNGQVQYANLYDFSKDGKLIFSVRCLNNKVIQVWDHRDKPLSYKSGSISSSRDDFRISDFTDPEDFYEWYYDDFTDYEEAEDYYYEHGGK